MHELVSEKGTKPTKKNTIVKIYVKRALHA